MTETGVLLGRFSPFHKGHQAEVEYMIEEHGIEKCLVMIGSSDSYNYRTPFTYEQRMTIIKAVYPEIKIIPLPDIKAKQIFFDGSTNQQWLASIKEIEKEMGVKFIFYGGSKEDLSVLSEAFETKIAVNRRKGHQEISATNVRRALDNHDDESLSRLLDPKVIPLVKEYYQFFLESDKNEKINKV
jgi:nicotinamide mononucleotide adenylyltransferase